MTARTHFCTLVNLRTGQSSQQRSPEHSHIEMSTETHSECHLYPIYLFYRLYIHLSFTNPWKRLWYVLALVLLPCASNYFPIIPKITLKQECRYTVISYGTDTFTMMHILNVANHRKSAQRRTTFRAQQQLNWICFPKSPVDVFMNACFVQSEHFQLRDIYKGSPTLGKRPKWTCSILQISTSKNVHQSVLLVPQRFSPIDLKWLRDSIGFGFCC